MKKYYKLLNLEEGCSIKEIKKQYKKICKELKQKQEDKDVEHIFKESLVEVREAYEKIMEEIQKSELAFSSKNDEQEISLTANDENEELISESKITQEEIYEEDEEEIINPVKKRISWKELILGILLLLIASGIWANVFISSNSTYETLDVRVVNTIDAKVDGSVSIDQSPFTPPLNINIAKINGHSWFYRHSGDERDNNGEKAYYRIPVSN